MKMKFVTMDGVKCYEKLEDVPYVFVCNTADYTEARAKGALVPREELDNQPVFLGFLGPMWDGGCLRYETKQVYDMLSE